MVSLERRSDTARVAGAGCCVRARGEFKTHAISCGSEQASLLKIISTSRARILHGKPPRGLAPPLHEIASVLSPQENNGSGSHGESEDDTIGKTRRAS